MDITGITILIFLILNIKSTEVYGAKRERNLQLAATFGEHMQARANHYSGYLVVKKNYELVEKMKYGKSIMQVERRNGTELVAGMSTDLRKMLKKKHTAVRKSVDVLESHSTNFQWGFTKTSDATAFPFYNAEYLNKEPAELDIVDGKDIYESQRKTLALTPDNRFLNRPVNFNRSVTQVPFDVYSRRADVMRVANWTQILDKQFKKNLKNDPSIKWQYFGSTEGLLRFYPAFQWKMYIEPDKPNVYDCRMRSWYTKAATFPKDMIILVDFSGSMDGLKMGIASHIVRTLLDTLGENDFFNILTYSDSVRYVEPCFTGTLIRADGRNKGRLMEFLKHIKPQGIADLGIALKTAFNLTLKFHMEGNGSGCYSSIVIITDGATDSYQDTLDQYKNMTDRQIRIFSYLVGSETSYMKHVKEIACNNDGILQQVLSRNDIKEKVLRYLAVMNRPQALQEDHHTIWTKPYYDQTFLDLGFGLVSTVAIPAYIQRSPNGSKSLGGVAATDVPIDHMLNSMLVHRTGVNGYVFILTNNGYVAAHPRLNTFFKKLYHYDDMSVKPNYNSIDIDDLEGTAVNDTIRAAILTPSTGSSDRKMITIPLDQWTRFIKVSGRYYYSGVDLSSTPFHVGMFLPDSYGERKLELARNIRIKKSPRPTIDQCPPINVSAPYKYPENEDLTREHLACGFLANNSIWLPNSWRYCHPRNESMLNSVDGRQITQLDLIKAYLFQQEKPNDPVECDLETVNHLLLDVFVSAALETFWRDRSRRSGAAIVAFIMTSSGMMRQHWQTKYCYEYRKNIGSILQGFDRQSFPSFYRRTVAYPDRDVYLVTPIAIAVNETGILISKAIRNNSGFIYGVSGAVMIYDDFTDTFWTDMNSSTYCPKDSDGLRTCYVIDENGIVLISNSESWKGDVRKSIADIDAHATKFLIEEEILSIVYLYDRTSLCKVDAPLQADELRANYFTSLRNPFTATFGRMTVWMTKFTSLLAKLTLSNMWTFMTNPSGIEATFKARENGQTIHYDVCDVRRGVLSVSIDGLPYYGSAECEEDCQRPISVEPIFQTNLFLLIVENVDCNCSSQIKSLSLQKKEIKYSQKEVCRRLREHKLGRKADGCDSHHRIKTENEDTQSQECSSGSSIHFITWDLHKFEKKWWKHFFTFVSQMFCFMPCLAVVFLASYHPLMVTV